MDDWLKRISRITGDHVSWRDNAKRRNPEWSRKPPTTRVNEWSVGMIKQEHMLYVWTVIFTRTHHEHKVVTNSLMDYGMFLVRTCREQMEAAHRRFCSVIYSSITLLTNVYHTEALCSDHSLYSWLLIKKVFLTVRLDTRTLYIRSLVVAYSVPLLVFYSTSLTNG
jgi:hypothetical protein